MTTKQIAAATDKSERSVQRWVERVLNDKMSLNGEKMSLRNTVREKAANSSPEKPADYDFSETLLIIETGLGKNAAGIYRANAEHIKALPDISLLMRHAIRDVIPEIVDAVRREALAIPGAPKKALPEPDGKPERDKLREIMKERGRHLGRITLAWNELWTHFNHRYQRDLRKAAKDRYMDTLDYAESEGLIGDLLDLATDLYRWWEK